MAGPFDPRQMPPQQNNAKGEDPAPAWRVVEADSGYPSSPPQSGATTGQPNYPNYPPYPGQPDYPAHPGYPGSVNAPAGPAWSPTPPGGAPPWGPGQAGQWGPSPASRGGHPQGAWGVEDARRTWEGWGPPTPRGTAPPPEPEEPTKPPSPLLIGACVALALILVAVAGAGIAYTQYRAPANAAIGFCNHVMAQDYGATFEDLSSSLQARYTPDAFVASARLADKLLGQVTACAATTDGSAYRFSLGGSSAQVPIALTRAQAGSFTEVVRLVPDHGKWRLLRLDAGLFGVDLAPLVAASTVCVDLRAHDYAALYGLMDEHARGTTKQEDFAKQGALHEQIDGAVSACQVLSVTKSSSASALTVIIGVTRPQTVNEQGQVMLALQNGEWQVDALAGNLLGSDLTPLTVGAQFCSALVDGNYPAAYGLMSENGKSGLSEQEFAYDMSGNGLIKWTGCITDYSSFTIHGGTASFTMNMQFTAPSYGANFAPGIQLSLVKQGNRWLVDASEIVY